jgi:prepilin-type N-terminal cleavage/methylation domain-containing protein
MGILSLKRTCKAARHSFSLIEIMVVIVLMGVIASVSAFSLWPLYKSYRFKLEVETLYELFQQLQLEAMTLQSDMQVRFTDTNGKWTAETKSDEPALKSQKIDLSHIDKISDDSVITFYSNGLVEKPKIIKFSYKDDHRWLDFSGGHLIKLCDKAPQPVVYEKLDIKKEIHEAQKSGL